MMHSPVTDGLWRPAGCALSLILAVWLVSIDGQPAIGQQAAVNEFRAYPLRYVSADEAERTLAKLLPPGSEVLADQRSNRVLVRGSAVAHQTVRDTLGSIDRSSPQPSAIALRTLSPPVLKGYACRVSDVAGLAARLEAEFASSGHVRVATDPRTAQVLVMAPPEIHAQIQTRLASTQASPAPTAPPASYSAQAPPPTGYSAQTAPPTGYSAQAPPRPAHVAPAFRSPGEVRREIRLQYTTGQQIETSLRAILGPRLLTALGGSVRAPAFEMTLRDGEVLQLAVNHQTGAVTVQGSNRAVEAFARLIAAMDKQPDAGGAESPGQSTQLVALRSAKPADVRRAVDALRSDQGTTATADGSSGAMMIARMFQQPDPTADPAGGQTPIVPENGGATGDATVPAGDAPAAGIGSQTSLIGPVRVEFLEGLDVLVISGHRRDVERVRAIIADIERLSQVTQPVIDILPLQHVDCESLQAMLVQLYDEILSSRQGSVSITALVKPNALLLIGRQENVQTVTNLARRLDRPVAPETQFRVFHLRYTSALEAEETAQAFFTERGGLGTKVLITSDFRANALVVRGSPRDIAEVAELILRLDTKESGTVNELKVFQLENSLAEDLVPILIEAIGSQQQSLSGTGGRTSGGQVPGGGTSGSQRRIGEKSTMLQFVTLDPQGQKRLNSGILTDARITADGRSNSVVVSAPAESLALIEALIRQLDQLPAAEAQVKLFTIVNGDASGMADMLETLFGQPAGGQQQQLPIQTAVIGEDSSLVSMRFSVDVRTNSIIATGSIGDLQVVEAILMRLDESEGRLRKSVVYRLKNAPATDVALAINQFLESERDVQQIEPGLLSAFEQMEREVVVVPEPVSNSLIVSATPRFFEEIEQLVLDLDEQPPMVMIQVLIVDVLLGSVDEFGIELGLQDSILFGRSEDGIPGFNFNNLPLGNGTDAAALNAAKYLAGQALSSFGVGRVSSETNYGGLVLSASSDSVSVLIRALKECRRVDVLSRPQIMTLDNQPAFVHVGQSVPQVTGTSVDLGTTNTAVEYANVGLILGVTPRISPDGLVVMEIDTEKSEVGSELEGIPISVSGGEVIRAPRINTITAQTTVSALSGQTIVLGGLITKKKTKVSRRVPFLGDLPLAGHLFRYDGEVEQRTELLIIMTPHIVRSEEEAERIKQVEAARMNWCLRDVVEIHGLDSGVRTRNDEWIDEETIVIYPDLDPDVPTAPKLAPTAPTPGRMFPTPGEMVPAPREIVPTPRRMVPTPGRAPTAPQPPAMPAPSFPQPAPTPAAQRPNTPMPTSTSQLQYRQQMPGRQTEPLVTRPTPYPVQPAGYWATAQPR
ncbi:MAG: hypothetical protein HQ581_13570 [Planctomycetes bacterium]|nr:hypothetical protein [Planctomycetota bacterium]